MRAVERFQFGRAHADLAHIAFLAADDHQVADSDRSFGEQNETGDKIVDEILQAEADADRKRARDDRNVG
jgi:hypothetical protein